jgi:hypothetical protein
MMILKSAVPLHADIPRTGGRHSDLAFEAVLQEYLQFPCENVFYFSSSIRGGVIVINFVPQTSPEKITRSEMLMLHNDHFTN